MVRRFERFSCAISEISRYWHKLAAEEMEKYGLKGSHSIYLTTLHSNSQGISSARLCELTGRDKADVSRMMRIMEQKGLVIREGASYRAKLKLTPEGNAAAEHVCLRAAKAVELAGGGMTGEERRIFYDALESIAANLRNLSETGLPENEQGECVCL